MASEFVSMKHLEDLDDCMENGESQSTGEIPPKAGQEYSPVAISPNQIPVIGWLTKLWSLSSIFAKAKASNSDNEVKRKQRLDYIIRVIHQCPEGYPRLAAMLSSDENFMIYRKFSYLQARLLLFKQDELRGLERDLEDMDRIHSIHSPEILRCRESDDAFSGNRKVLLEKISQCFQDYAKLVSAASSFASLKKPPYQDFVSVRSYFDEMIPVCDTESFIYNKEDIVTLKPGRNDALLDLIFARALRKFQSGLTRYFLGSRALSLKADYKTTGLTFYSRSKLSIVVAFITIITMIALLITPVFILIKLSQNTQANISIGAVIPVLLGFTLLLALVLAICTRARRHEILASSGAYCTVLLGIWSKLTPAKPLCPIS